MGSSAEFENQACRFDIPVEFLECYWLFQHAIMLSFFFFLQVLSSLDLEQSHSKLGF